YARQSSRGVLHMSFLKSFLGGGLPKFKYFPSASSAGEKAVILHEPIECLSCEREREYVYVGPVYAEEELDQNICPWCISNGAANKKFGAQFNPVADIEVEELDEDPHLSMGHNRWGDWQSVPQRVIEEIAYRTPGVAAWQEANWFFHCKDAAIYLGPVGFTELKGYGHQAFEAIRQEAQKFQLEDAGLDKWMSGLSTE